MFTHAAVAKLNALEMMVYHYVIKNKQHVMYMTIRELASAVHVSTTTVLRFCRKFNCAGYAEFRVRFKLYLEQQEIKPVNFGASEIVSFFKSTQNQEFEQLIEQAANIIVKAERVIFIGVGSSGALAKYGASFFSNFGKFSSYIDDPYFPVSQDMTSEALVIVLSVSGETPDIIRLASQLSLKQCKIMSITSTESASLAKIADFNLSWHIPPMRLSDNKDITTQIPTLYIIETLGRLLSKNQNKKT